jgi:glycine/D-amino acid oxidase-like deaminating enzyme
LSAKAAQQGVRIFTGVTVTGFDLQSRLRARVRTDHGDIRAELLIIGGAMVRTFLEMLDSG